MLHVTHRWAVSLLVFVLAVASYALINPNYVPGNLVQQSEWIAVAELGLPGADGACSAKVVHALKGQVPQLPAMHADLVDAELLPTLKAAFGKQTTVSALLFGGDYKDAAIIPEGGDDGNAGPVGALHFGTAWFGLFQEQDGTYRIGMDQLNLKAVWAGGNAMLEQAINYVLADPLADFPVKVGVEWARDVRIDAVDGTVTGLQAVDVLGEGKPCIFVAAEEGDRLYYAGADGEFQEVSERMQLTSKSKRALWADMNADGKPDLLSWDGQALNLYLQTPAKTMGEAVKLGDVAACTSLSLLDSAVAGKPAVLIDTPQPCLFVPNAAGAYTRQVLPALDQDTAGKVGAGQRALVADFTGDGLTDIVALCSKGALLYKGTGPAAFANAVVVAQTNMGTTITGAAVGDFDADGSLDVMASSEIGCTLLSNTGTGQFLDTVLETGEVVYISKPNMIATAVCDINNDGRQDVGFFYRDMAPQFFFNRGFRVFGHAIQLDFMNAGLGAVDALNEGQQAGLVADLNGDGAEDMLTVTTGGELWAIYRDGKAPFLGMQVALPTGVAGPLTVMGYDGKRCLGARVATAAAPAFFGKKQKGPLTLKWHDAQGQEQTKTSVVLKPTRMEAGR